jgi:hypothetical protein
MSIALKISDGHFIPLSHVKELYIDNSTKTIHLIIDFDRPDILISPKDLGEGEYHRIKREIEEFFSIDF